MSETERAKRGIPGDGVWLWGAHQRVGTIPFRGAGVYGAVPLRYIPVMIHESQIQQVALQLADAARASQVILFGSYARGEATDRSDVDLMVVAETDLPRHKRAVSLYRQFRPYPFGMDIVVYTPQEIEEEKKSALTFVSAVLREGKTLYGRREESGQTVAGQSTE